VNISDGVMMKTKYDDCVVYAIVPARNENEIAATVESLKSQVDLVVVIANNCIDNGHTVRMAKYAGAYVIEMINNVHLRAGACSHGMQVVNPYLRDNDVVMFFDADSIIASDFVEKALPYVRKHGCLSGSFETINAPGILPLMQTIEYAQARHRTKQKNGFVHVLSGGANMWKVNVLRHIARERGGLLPGTFGDWLLPGSMAEDLEMTLAAKKLGYDPVSPAECKFQTDTMQTMRDLWRQRMRWQIGLLETLKLYPLRLHWTLSFYTLWVYVCSLMPLLSVALIIHALFNHTYSYSALWLMIIPLFALAEMWASKAAGWRAVVVAGIVIPMWLLGTWRNVVYYCAAYKFFLMKKQSSIWH
jgi:biofilm PGA synthesis N-glycosyltransferase PgaC